MVCIEIQKITLEHFRNIGHLELHPEPGVNIIYGENAQGKTNLLEAVWLFTGAKSFRGSKEKELIEFGQSICRSEVDYFCAGRFQNAVMEFRTDGNTLKKTITVNDVPLNSAEHLAGRFYSVVFSPVHLSLVKDGPDMRRRFLDTAIGQIVPKYGGTLREYKRILMQRNALMKDLGRFPQLQDTVEVWDENLSRVGAALTYSRARYIDRVAPMAEEIYNGISGGKEAFRIYYRSVIPMEQAMTIQDIKVQMLKELRDSRKTDIEHGLTSVGPHRDDIEFMINDKPMRSYGSQGQQRSGVLALKMAECGMVEEAVGETPIILLDDVMSELDWRRRDYLLNHIEGRQVFVTCCDDESFSSMKEGGRFPIQNGKLIG